jgi:hypothetical protein
METTIMLHGKPVCVWHPEPEILRALGLKPEVDDAPEDAEEGREVCWSMPHPFVSGIICRIWLHLPRYNVVLTEHDAGSKKPRAGKHRFSGHLTKEEHFDLVLQMAGWAHWT